MDDWQPNKRRKDETVAFALGITVPGTGQLYAEDWALGAYFLLLDVAAALLWASGHWVFAIIAGAFSWIGGLWLIPNSLRKFQDREGGRPPTFDDFVADQ